MRRSLGSRGTLGRLALMATLAGPALLGGCAQTEKAFKPSVEDQKKVGAEAAREVDKKYKIVNDERARRFERVANRLVSSLTPEQRSKWAFTFKVVDSKEVNAFALPGGPIYMFTGLLEKIGSDDELAAVTAHEIAHVTGEHWARQAAKEQSRTLGLIAILQATDAGSTAETAAGLLNTVVGLRYSRKDESNSDEDGFNLMVRAGYDPQGMLALFRTLKAASGSGGGAPEFLLSHPVTDERIQRTEERIAAMKADGAKP